MALNPNIPLSGKTPDIGGPLMQLAQTKVALDQKKGQQKSPQEQFNEREKARLQSLVTAAQQVKPFLENNDIQGATSFLQRRQQSLQESGIDSSDTQEMLQIVAQDPRAALQTVNEAIQLGDQMGFIKTGLLSPEQEQQKARIASAGATQVNVDTKGRETEAKELAKLRASNLGEIQAKALQAEEQNVGLQQLENIDVKTGFGEEAKGQLARTFNAFGVNGNELVGVDPANIQAFNAVSGKLVLDVMATQKGPQTDKDQERIAKTLPTIKNEANANKFTLNSLKAINFRRMEQRDFYESYLEENETLKGADRAWSEFKNKTPMLSDNIKNPETGLPMFFHDFKQKTLDRNPNASDQQIINAWRELNG